MVRVTTKKTQSCNKQIILDYDGNNTIFLKDPADIKEKIDVVAKINILIDPKNIDTYLEYNKRVLERMEKNNS
ncbi:MAG: hypothetical protein ACRCVI_00855 [Mycoplasmoidaceae bacterium]